jgi:ribosomal protein S18 acetylase RimI-like enzyme
MTPEVAVPTEDDLPALLETMRSGFDADPLYRWLYPDPRQRTVALGETFELMLDRGISRGHVRCTDDHRAVAIWAEPGVALLFDGDMGSWLQRLRHQAPAVVDDAVAAMAACGGHVPQATHWTLHSLVVHAERQGRGLGSALLRATLTVVDATGGLAYLESSNARNLAVYERVGFRVAAEVPIAGGPTMRPMLREPPAAPAV